MISTPNESPLRPSWTFDTFVAGASNQYAHAVAMELANAPTGTYTPLFIHGAQGLGKTHLAQATAHAMAGRDEQLKILFSTAEAFTNAYIVALRNQKAIEFRCLYRSCDVLVLDDIHFWHGRSRALTEFFHTLNELVYNSKQVIVTSGCPPSALSTFGKRLVSRLQQGLVVEIKEPDQPLLLEFLHAKNKRMDYGLGSTVLGELAKRIAPNFRVLEGAFLRLGTWRMLTGRDVTVLNIKELLSDLYIEAQKNKNEETDTSRHTCVQPP
jgi:chromosomal replication initiator protein